MLRWIRKDEQVVQTRYLQLIEKELAYYRERFDKELNRSDRAVDQLLESKGVPLPVSDLGIHKHEDLKTQFQESQELMKVQLAEIYGDSETSELSTESEPAESK